MRLKFEFDYHSYKFGVEWRRFPEYNGGGGAVYFFIPFVTVRLYLRHTEVPYNEYD